MADKKTTAADIHKLIKEKEVKYVDVRFTDPQAASGSMSPST